MQLVPAIHGGDPDPTAALPEKLAAGGSGEDLWIAGASVLTRDAILSPLHFTLSLREVSLAAALTGL